MDENCSMEKYKRNILRLELFKTGFTMGSILPIPLYGFVG